MRIHAVNIEDNIKNMNTRTILLSLLLLAALSASGQTHMISDKQDVSFQSQQIVRPISAYQGAVYAPFNEATPADYYSDGASNSPATMSTGADRGFVGGPESGQGPSPVGEPWIMLLFAATLAAVTAWRKRKGRIMS